MKKGFYSFMLISAFAVSCSSGGDKTNSGNSDSQHSDSTQKTQTATKQSSALDTALAFGIDISHYQGALLHEITVADGLDFVICKATQGDQYVDSYFHKNWDSIPARGYIRGAYHFYRSEDDPAKQAQFFVNTLVGHNSSDLPPILDIEELSLDGAIAPEKLQADILTFLQEVEKLSKRKPILYTDPTFANQYLKNDKLAAYPLWLAEYTKRTPPSLPQTWKTPGYTLWQKSGSYSLDNTQTDYDVFKGTREELEAFIKSH